MEHGPHQKIHRHADGPIERSTRNIDRMTYMTLAVNLVAFLQLKATPLIDELRSEWKPTTTAASAPEAVIPPSEYTETKISDDHVRELITIIPRGMLRATVSAIEHETSKPRLPSLDAARHPNVKIYMMFDAATRKLIIYPDADLLTSQELQRVLVIEIANAQSTNKKLNKQLADAILDPESLSHEDLTNAQNFFNMFETKDYAIRH